MRTTIQKRSLIPIGYPELLETLREKIRSSQLKATLAVNCELLSLYWEIGAKVLLKQKNEGWGSKIVETLSKDLRSAFPNMKGFSLTNVKYMVQFARTYPMGRTSDLLSWSQIESLLAVNEDGKREELIQRAGKEISAAVC